jgi:autotransporter-associated beta strand protein
MKPDGISPYVNGSGNWRFDMVTVLNDVSVSPGANVTWTNASGTGVWNTTDGNWSGGSPVANKYKDNDNAIFGSISSDATITVNAAGVAPGSTSVSNPANTYTFTGGSINGTGALIKSSTGTVVLNSANGYSGGTVVNGGTLIVNGGDDRLGAANGPLTLAGGTLQTSGTDLSSARRFTVGGNGGTFNSNGFSSSTTGHTDVNGVLTKTGTGNLTLNGSVAFDNNGTLVVDSGGSVTFGGVSDTITMRNGGTFNGNLVLNMDSSDPADPARLNFNGTVPYSGTGEIQVQKPNIVITNSSQNSAAAPIDVYVSLQLNSSNNEFTKSDVTLPNPLSVAHPFVTTIGGTRDATQEGTVPNNLHFHNPITGDSDFNVSNDPAGLGSGNLWLDAQNTYTGATLINGDHTATVFIAVDNALPTGTDVIFGTGSALVPGQSMPVIDLYGHSQQVNSLSCGRFGRAADFSITNTGNGDSVLKISGSTTPYRPFGGVIQDGTHKVSLEKDGSGTLSLSYTNTYTGTTAILGGTLALATAYDAFGYPVSTGDLSLATVISTSGTGVFQINDGVHFVGTVVGTGTTKILADASLSVADITQGTLDMAAGASIAIDGPNSSAIGTITGHGNVTVHNEATLSAGSITAESLSIGGVAAVAVPEPGTLIFVVSAALAGICQFLRRRR